MTMKLRMIKIRPIMARVVCLILLANCEMFGDDVYLRNGQVLKNCRVIDEIHNRVRIKTSANHRLIPSSSIDKIVHCPFDSLSPTAIINADGTMTEMVMTQNGEGILDTSPPYSASESTNSPEILCSIINGKHYNGKILYVTDYGIVLWQGAGTNGHTASDTSELIIPSAEIQRIIIHNESKAWSGFGKGGLIGGCIGVVIGLMSGDDTEGLIQIGAGTKALILGGTFGLISGAIGMVSGGIQGIDDQYDIGGDSLLYRKILPKLQKIAIGPYSQLPSVIERIQQRNIVNVFSPAEGQVTDERSEPWHTRAQFHFTFSGNLMSSSAGADMSDAFSRSGFGGTSSSFFGTATYPVTSGNYVSWSAGGEYSVSDNMRIGAQWIELPVENVSGIESEEEFAKGNSIEVSITYVPAPIDIILLTRSEISFAAGITYSRITVDGNFASWSYSSSIGNYSVRGQSVGAVVRMNYDYYLSRSLSLQGRLEGRYSPEITVPSISIIDPYDNKSKTLVEHGVGFSGVAFSLGLQLHL